MPGISPEAKRARIEQLTMRRNKLTRDAIAAHGEQVDRVSAGQHRDMSRRTTQYRQAS